MTDQDQVKPYHAKDVAPGQEAADVVAEVLKHAAEREEAGKKKTTVAKGPAKWMLPLTVNMGVLALYFLIAQPDFLVMSPIVDTRSVEDQVQTTRDMMYVTGIRVEGFLGREGRLPATLAEANDPNGSFDYSIQGDSTYILIATVGGQSIVFDSAAQTLAEFAAGLADRITG